MRRLTLPPDECGTPAIHTDEFSHEHNFAENRGAVQCYRPDLFPQQLYQQLRGGMYPLPPI